MTKATTYKGASIEQERDGTYSVFWAGNPFATTGGYKSVEEAKNKINGA